jgi:hypothetical protein
MMQKSTKTTYYWPESGIKTSEIHINSPVSENF